MLVEEHGDRGVASREGKRRQRYGRRAALGNSRGGVDGDAAVGFREERRAGRSVEGGGNGDGEGAWGGVAAGDAALPGVAGDAVEEGVVEEVAEEHAEAAEGVVGAEGDADGVAAVGELFHLHVDVEFTCGIAGVADGGFADADGCLEERVVE